MTTDEFFERASTELTEFLTQANPYRSLLILIVSLVVSYWLSRFVAKFIILIAQKVAVRSDNESDAIKAVRLRQVETYLGVTVAVVRVVIVAVVAYVSWRILSPVESSRLGGSGAAAIGASAVFIVVAGQTVGPILRDITAGATIIIERWFTVGDYVKVEPFWNVTGVVERLTLRSTKLRTLSGEVIWIHNQKIDAVHVTPNGVRTLAVDVLVNDKEGGDALIKRTISKLPTGHMTVAGKLKVVDTIKYTDELWMVTVQGKTVPGREWLIENYFVNQLQKENGRLLKKNRVLEGDPIVRYADPETEKRFRRAVRVQQQK
jgi:small conductance mechanosensitive channel